MSSKEMVIGVRAKRIAGMQEWESPCLCVQACFGELLSIARAYTIVSNWDKLAWDNRAPLRHRKCFGTLIRRAFLIRVSVVFSFTQLSLCSFFRSFTLIIEGRGPVVVVTYNRCCPEDVKRDGNRKQPTGAYIQSN